MPPASIPSPARHARGHARPGVRPGAPTALVLASLAAVFCAPLRAQQAPLNVVVMDICSARADHFGTYGYPKPTTPGLDSLAKEAVVFDRAMAQASWCLPNYATLFTGHVPEVHGQYTNTPFRGMPPFETTLAERMQRAGYRTAAFSGGIYFLKAWGLDRGFDRYVNLFSTSSAVPASFSLLAPQALAWVEQNRESPFFLYTAVDDLHTPYQSENPELYDPGYDGVVHDTAIANVRFFRLYNGEPSDASDPLLPKLDVFRKDPRHLAHLAAHYDASLNGVDRKVSDFVRRLKDMDLWKNTVLVITSDHGELLGEKGLLGHTEGLYEPVLRVPMIVHHPGFPQLKGRRVGELVERIDLTPTVLDVAGASYEDGELQGRSLIPLLRNPDEPLHAHAFAASKRNMATRADFLIDERVARDKRWKLHWYLHKNDYELYDIDNDPLETRDVSREHPEIVQRLSFELLRSIETTRPHAPGLPSGKQPGKGFSELERLHDVH